jgi:hypothetical protein
VYGEKGGRFRGHPQGPGFKTENLFGGLINEEEIQGRLLFLADQTLGVARELSRCDSGRRE